MAHWFVDGPRALAPNRMIATIGLSLATVAYVLSMFSGQRI